MASNYTDEQIAAYAAAVQARLTELGKSRRWLAGELGISAQAMAERVSAFPGTPARVYEMEDVLEAPGYICRHLGYLRPGVEYEMIECPGIVELLNADPSLDKEGREMLASMYRRLVELAGNS